MKRNTVTKKTQVNKAAAESVSTSSKQSVALAPPTLKLSAGEAFKPESSSKASFTGATFALPTPPTIDAVSSELPPFNLGNTPPPPIQKKATNSNPPAYTAAASTSTGSLPTDVRAKMENAFKADFSSVKISPNSQSAVNMGAQAYAQGNNLHFAPGRFNPNSTRGQELIGHELTHVIQQRAGKVKPTIQAKGLAINDDTALEREADVLGARAAQGKDASSIAGGTKASSPVSQMKSEGAVVQRFLGGLGKKLKSAGSSALSFGKKAVSKGSSALSSVAGFGKKAFSKAKSASSSALSSVAGHGKKAVSSVSKAAGKAKSIGSSALSSVAGFGKKTVSKAKNIGSSALSSVAGYGKKVASKVGNVAEKAKSIGSSALSSAAGFGSEVWEGVKKGDSILDEDKSFGNRLGQAGLSVMSNLGTANKGKELLGSIGDLRNGGWKKGDNWGNIVSDIAELGPGGELLKLIPDNVKNDFWEGALKGDLIADEDKNWSQLAGQVVTGFIPGVGFAADLRDTAVSLNKMRNGGWKKFGSWTNLAANLVAFVPGGDLIKAIPSDKITKFISKNTGVVADAFKALKKGGLKNVDETLDLAKPILNSGAKHANEAVDVLKGGTKKATSKLGKAFELLKDGAKSLGNEGKKAFSGLGDMIKSGGTKAMNTISDAWSSVRSSGTSIKNKGLALWSKITESAPGKIIKKISGKIKGFLDAEINDKAIKNHLRPVKNKVFNLLTNWHYNRNQRQKNQFSQSGPGPNHPGFRLAPNWQNLYHQHGEGGKGNRKYISRDGGNLEFVYDKNGNLVTDEQNKGTYNFFGPDTLKGIPHIFFDVLPYWALGNSKDDKTPLLDRVGGPGAKDKITGKAKGLWNGVKSLGPKAIGGVKAAGSWLGDKAKSAWNGAKYLGSKAWNGVKSAGSWIGGKAKGAWNGAKSLGSKAWNGVKSAGSWIGGKAKGAWNGAKSLGSKAWNDVKSAGSWIGGKAKGAWNGAKSLGSKAWNGVKSAGSWIGGKAKGAWNGAKYLGSKAIGGVKSAYKKSAIAKFSNLLKAGTKDGISNFLFGPKGERIDQSEIDSAGFDEYMSDLAYIGEGREETGLAEEDKLRLTKQGYDPESFRVIEGENGFQAITIQPSEGSGLNPYMSIRGSEEKKDWASNADKAQVGNRQFDNNKELIERVLLELAEPSMQNSSNRNSSNRIDMSGHSLGGGVAQRITAEYPELISRLTTFQAPGQSNDVDDLYEENIANMSATEVPDISHHYVKGGIVDNAGERHLAGKHYRHESSALTRRLNFHGFGLNGLGHIETLTDKIGRPYAGGEAATNHKVTRYNSFPDPKQRVIAEMLRWSASPIVKELID